MSGRNKSSVFFFSDLSVKLWCFIFATIFSAWVFFKAPFLFFMSSLVSLRLLIKAFLVFFFKHNLLWFTSYLFPSYFLVPCPYFSEYFLKTLVIFSFLPILEREALKLEALCVWFRRLTVGLLGGWSGQAFTGESHIS